jgi:hypothetical protein
MSSTAARGNHVWSLATSVVTNVSVFHQGWCLVTKRNVIATITGRPRMVNPIVLEKRKKKLGD